METNHHKLILRLMQRPDGQIALLLASVLLLSTWGGYQFCVLPQAESADARQGQIQQQQQYIRQQQRVLLLQPSRAALQRELEKASQFEELSIMPPLPQQILAPLNAAGGRLLHWTPDVKPADAPGDFQQQGVFTLQLHYAGLLQFLQELLKDAPTSIVIEQLRVGQRAGGEPHVSPALLEVSLRLATYPGLVTKQEKDRTAELFAEVLPRDPFATEKIETCRDTGGWPEMAQLRGVLGDAEKYVGWLMLSAGTWLKVEPGQMLPDSQWRIEEVREKQVFIRFNSPQCGVQEQTLILAGS